MNIIGKRFGRLIVVERNGWSPNGANSRLKAYLCVCDCGKKTTTSGSSLVRKRTTSCGCYAAEISRESSTTHGMANTAVYTLWKNMKSRCSKNAGPKDKPIYWDKGIRVCKDWEDFSNFYKWAKDHWEAGLTIDRIDNTRGYRPDNCRFVSNQVNMFNRSDSRYWFVWGKRFESCNEAAKFWELANSTIHEMCKGRYRYGKFHPPEQHCYTIEKYNGNIYNRLCARR